MFYTYFLRFINKYLGNADKGINNFGAAEH